NGPEEGLSRESLRLVETTGPQVRDLECAAELAPQLVLRHDRDGKLRRLGGAERQDQEKAPGAGEPAERAQGRIEGIPACEVIAAAIHHHVERLSDSANLGHVSGEEANASAGRMTGRAAPSLLDGGRGEIHSHDLESVLRQQERLDAAATAEVEGASLCR